MSVAVDTRHRLVGAASSFVKGTLNRYRKLTWVGKLVVWLIILVHIAAVIFFIVVTPKRIMQALYNFAQRVASRRDGWLIFGSLLILTSFPPLSGQTTTFTLCGFAYGVKGFLIAAPGSMLGAALAYLVLRYLFGRKLRSMTVSNKRWQALVSVIRARGMPLVILIRMSPFPPWVWSNTFFASLEGVRFWQFMVASLFTLPKLFLSVFLGSRIAEFSDDTRRGQMDATAKAINILSIVFSIALTMTIGIVVYRLVQREIRKNADGRLEDLAREGYTDIEEGAPLLVDMSDDEPI